MKLEGTWIGESFAILRAGDSVGFQAGVWVLWRYREDRYQRPFLETMKPDRCADRSEC